MISWGFGVALRKKIISGIPPLQQKKGKALGCEHDCSGQKTFERNNWPRSAVPALEFDNLKASERLWSRRVCTPEVFLFQSEQDRMTWNLASDPAELFGNFVVLKSPGAESFQSVRSGSRICLRDLITNTGKLNFCVRRGVGRLSSSGVRM